MNLDVIYPSLRDNPDNIYGFLLVSGYLTCVDEVDWSLPLSPSAHLALPNREIQELFEKEIVAFLNNGNPGGKNLDLGRALASNDPQAVQRTMGDYLSTSISCFLLSSFRRGA